MSVSGIPVEDVKQWRGQDVVDPEANKLGRLVEILYDARSDSPAFVIVRSGHVGGRHVTLVPLSGASAGQDYLRVTIEKSAFKEAPSFDPERELSAATRPAPTTTTASLTPRAFSAPGHSPSID